MASHTVRSLNGDENKDLNIICEKDTFMTKCRLYHGNKLKVGDSTLPKVETVIDEDDYVGVLLPIEEPVEASQKDGDARTECR